MLYPEFPADLSTLSTEELAELALRCQEWTTDALARSSSLKGEAADELFTQMQSVAAGFERVSAEQTARSAVSASDTDRTEDIEALAAQVLGGQTSAPPSGDGPGGGADAPTAPAAVNAGTVRVLRHSPNQIVMPDGAVYRRDDGGNAVLAAVPSEAAERMEDTLGRRLSPAERADLSLRSRTSALPALTALRDGPEPIRAEAEPIVAAAGLSVPQGSHMADMAQVARELKRRREGMGYVPDSDGSEQVVVASILSELPDARHLFTGQDSPNWDKIEAVTSRQGIQASGGLCAPVTPYYGILTLAGAMRPVRDAAAGFTADRGGITFVPPPQLSDAGAIARTVTDGATTNTSTTVTSATAAFLSNDVGASISGSGIPAGAYIVVVTNATTVTISAAATATATGVTLTITRQGSSVIITAAQDASALGGTQAQIVAATKPCLHVTCPGITTVNVAAVTRCLEFGNFTARAYPEQVTAWLALAVAQWARTAETALLDRLSALSTQVTMAAVNGAARQLVAQLVKAASYYRNRNRMDRDAPLRALFPAWVIDLAVADVVLGSGSEMEFFSMARSLVTTALEQANVNLSFYVDSGTGKGQLINSGTKQAAGAFCAFPTTVVWYLFSEGTFLFLDGGTLDFGLIRDSALNSQNAYRLFAESWEAMASVGVESLELTSTVVASGAASALVTPPSAF